MLPSLSKHFIKAMMAPHYRGPTQEELASALDGKAGEERLAIVQAMHTKRGVIRLDQPHRNTP